MTLRIRLIGQQAFHYSYTLSHLENDRDVSAYPGGRRLSSHAQLVCFLMRQKGTPSKSDVTVVLGMRYCIVISFYAVHQPICDVTKQNELEPAFIDF